MDIDANLKLTPCQDVSIVSAFAMSNQLFCQIDGDSGADQPAQILSVLQDMCSLLLPTEIRFASAVSVLSLQGLTCQNCVRKVQKCLQGLGPGLRHCDIDLSLAFIDYDPSQLSPGRLVEAVASADPKFSARYHRDVEAALRGLKSDRTKKTEKVCFQGMILTVLVKKISRSVGSSVVRNLEICDFPQADTGTVPVPVYAT